MTARGILFAVSDNLRFSSPPRSVPPTLIIANAFNLVAQIGWAVFGFGMIFFWAFVGNADLSFLNFRGPFGETSGQITKVERTGASENKRSIYANYYTYSIAGQHLILSPIDLTSPADAAEWERMAMDLRPWRTEFFNSFVAQIQPPERPAQILELGSGPGFLALHLLSRMPNISMALLDFSAAMHALSRARLGSLATRVTFVEKSFKEPDWPANLGPFDFVVTNQTVHELRHKRYARALHEQVRDVLVPDGAYLVCDHYVGADGMDNEELYMTVDEQRESLLLAGFTQVTEIKCKRGMVLHRAA